MDRQPSKSFQTLAAAQQYYREQGMTGRVRVRVFGRTIVLGDHGVVVPQHEDATRTVAVPGVRL